MRAVAGRCLATGVTDLPAQHWRSRQRRSFSFTHSPRRVLPTFRRIVGARDKGGAPFLHLLLWTSLWVVALQRVLPTFRHIVGACDKGGAFLLRTSSRAVASRRVLPTFWRIVGARDKGGAPFLLFLCTPSRAVASRRVLPTFRRIVGTRDKGGAFFMHAVAGRCLTTGATDLPARHWRSRQTRSSFRYAIVGRCLTTGFSSLILQKLSCIPSIIF